VECGPALAMLDIVDVPHGLLALDVLSKEAYVEVVSAGTVQSGRYLILFGGDVEPVELAYVRAHDVVGPMVADAMMLPYAEERLLPAVMQGTVRWPAPGDTAGVLQNDTSPTMLRAIDVALKGALVDLVELRVADGLAGKAMATLWGETHDVEAAIELATLSASRSGALGWSSVVIRNADPSVHSAVQPNSRFFGSFRG
jgi:microcompartment protein CcmL/EutN